jgi:hypothetical protein
MPEYLKPEKRSPKERRPIPTKSKKRLEKEAQEKASGIFYLKVGKPLKRITTKQGQIEAEKSAVYRQRSEGERPFCQGCGRYDKPLSNSHRIGQSNKEHAANAANLDTYCIGDDSCHTKYECGYIFVLDNGNEVLEWLSETDDERYRIKVWKMLDRIKELDLLLEDLPAWVQSHVLKATT